jgi:hypothetical protein
MLLYMLESLEDALPPRYVLCCGIVAVLCMVGAKAEPRAVARVMGHVVSEAIN